MFYYSSKKSFKIIIPLLLYKIMKDNRKCLNGIGKHLCYLPSNNLEKTLKNAADDDSNRICFEINKIISGYSSKLYIIRDIMKLLEYYGNALEV